MGKPRFGKRKHGKERTLDGEYIFKYMYKELGMAGSWKKVAAHVTKKYGVNPENGKAWSPEGVLFF